jgi:Restriction endonuclease
VTRISNRRVNEAFANGDAAPTAHAKGRFLEDLLAYAFEKYPGIRLIERNAHVAAGSEEIDLVFWNDRLPNGLPFLPNILMFECKNWAQPVGSAAVVYYVNKIRSRHLEFGFLIAANGVTGDKQDLGAAQQHLHNALIRDNVKIIIINRSELCGLKSTHQLTVLIQDKIAQIILRA